MTTKPEAPTQALTALIAAKAEIDTMLARLTALSHYVGVLRQITDSAFSEGELAE
jgi:hypothetical protein